MEYKTLKDSGKREDMSTGSRRDTQEGKSRPDLMNPLVLRRLGQHFANGCVKYGEKNFELGQKTSRYRASLGRHLLDYDEGKQDEDHLSAIIWNAMGIVLNEEFVEKGIYPEEMDDYSDYRDKDCFDNTVGARAMAHNDKLRQAEVDAEGLKAAFGVEIPNAQLYVEEHGEDLVDVPELPVCFGNCGDNCVTCSVKSECDAQECGYDEKTKCEFSAECQEEFTGVDDASTHLDDMMDEVESATRNCFNCKHQMVPGQLLPCRVCIINVNCKAIVPRDMFHKKEV